MERSFYRILFRSALAALVLLIFSAGGAGGTLYAWHLARQDSRLRTICLIAGIVSGMIAALLMGFAMRALDRPMLDHVPPWYIRWPLKINKRIILLTQIAATGLAVASAFFLAFDFRIPTI